jgi:hypothetical protein
MQCVVLRSSENIGAVHVVRNFVAPDAEEPSIKTWSPARSASSTACGTRVVTRIVAVCTRFSLRPRARQPSGDREYRGCVRWHGHKQSQAEHRPNCANRFHDCFPSQLQIQERDVARTWV